MFLSQLNAFIFTSYIIFYSHSHPQSIQLSNPAMRIYFNALSIISFPFYYYSLPSSFPFFSFPCRGMLMIMMMIIISIESFPSATAYSNTAMIIYTAEWHICCCWCNKWREKGQNECHYHSDDDTRICIHPFAYSKSLFPHYTHNITQHIRINSAVPPPPRTSSEKR